jgi:RNA polymerase sigma-70 factor (ECF subfamily)
LTANDDDARVPRKQKGSSAAVEPVFDGNFRAVRYIDDFELFYKSWFRPLLRLLLTLTRDRLLAEDVAQETMIVMKGDWEKVKDKEQPKYILGVGIRILRRIEARMQKENESMNLLLQLANEEYIAPDTNSWVIEHQDIVRAIRSLPRRQAEVIALHYLCDFTLTDIAEILSLTIGAVKFHLHHARGSLKDRMDDPDGGTGRSR